MTNFEIVLTLLLGGLSWVAAAYCERRHDEQESGK